jgi:medium-chain acyl-[acyl-carrier-protein] hydrolase
MESYRESFTVHSYEVDAFGLLAVPALTGFLIEAAGLHAARLGVGLDTLMERGLTWVLARQRLEIPVAIRLGDVLEVETWPIGIERLAALRNFVVRREDGTEVARATTQWFVLDQASRRPVRPDAVLDARFPRERTGSVVELGTGKLPELRSWDFQKRFHVRYQDIDVNLHANNGSYVAWALEAIPREVWQSSRLTAVEVQYLAECHYGSAVLSRLASQDAPAPAAAFAHAVVREEDEKELARVITAWTPR